jgi:hypothetical protein
MATIRLNDLQRAYQNMRATRRRYELRCYLIDRDEPTPNAFCLISRRLYCDGLIDNLGLAQTWLDRASVTERASLFSLISTALLRG